MSDTYADSNLRKIFRDVSTIAMVGASQRGARDSHRVMRYLQQNGFRVIPVNPTLRDGATILGEKVYENLAAIPDEFQLVDVFRRPAAVAGIVDEVLALKRKPNYLWLQLGVVDETAAQRARDAGIAVIMDRCIKIEHGRLRP